VRYSVASELHRSTRHKGGEHADTSVQTVKQLAESMHLSSVKVLQGIFPTATGNSVGDAFRFAHLDLDVYEGTPHETEIYVRLQRADVMFSIVYPHSDNELRPVQGGAFST
jgi:hypothetical protein